MYICLRVYEFVCVSRYRHVPWRLFDLVGNMGAAGKGFAEGFDDVGPSVRPRGPAFRVRVSFFKPFLPFIKS